MNMLNRGSLLVEVIIYLALLAVLGICAFTWFARSQRQLLRFSESNNMLMQLYSATDLLVRDLRRSPRTQSAWLVQGPHSIIWRTSDGDVGWYAQKNKLYRVEGAYNPNSGKWIKQKRTIALQGLEQIELHLIQKKEEIDHIEVALVATLGGARHRVQESVYPRKELR